MSMAEKRWIAETLFDELGFRISYRVDKLLYETQTEHQHLVLFEQPFFGKMLMIDGATQISSRGRIHLPGDDVARAAFCSRRSARTFSSSAAAIAALPRRC